MTPSVMSANILFELTLFSVDNEQAYVGVLTTFLSIKLQYMHLFPSTPNRQLTDNSI